jgi:hypothetical protein
VVLVENLIDDLLNVVDLSNEKEHTGADDGREDQCADDQGNEIDDGFRDVHLWFSLKYEF